MINERQGLLGQNRKYSARVRDCRLPAIHVHGTAQRRARVAHFEQEAIKPIQKQAAMSGMPTRVVVS